MAEVIAHCETRRSSLAFCSGVRHVTHVAEEFRRFLGGFLGHLERHLPKGGIAMVCMDWLHVAELIGAGKAAGFELINLCVWNKTNGGMGSLYRSKHELVCIFRNPGGAHVNNVELGRHGRNRTNVWDHAGVNSFGAGREADLADHPTVKPTALLAAERTGRRARLIELDPLYVDVAIRRWQEMTGGQAREATSGECFAARAERVAAAQEEAADG
jgi:DNA modification methylase